MLTKTLFKFASMTLVFLFSSGAMARNPINISDYKLVPDSEVLKVLHPAPAFPETILKSNVNILVWNTHKGEDGNKWAQDLKALSEDRQLVLLQEGMDDNFMPSALKALDQFGWLMAQSFYMNGFQNGTGVITGSVRAPFSAIFNRTKDLEPVVNTPKVTLFSVYTMEKGSRLLVVNIHGINFTTTNPFIRQINEITDLIKAWKEKVIFAGDFNTWSDARLDYLLKKTREAGLVHVAFIKDTRKLKLDHIFLRGCASFRSQIHDNISSSDHKPLTADLVCPE